VSYVAEERNGTWVVVHHAPTVVAQDLDRAQAEALAFQLNVERNKSKKRFAPPPPPPTTVAKGGMPRWIEPSDLAGQPEPPL
jgi:hypothetical protein